MSDEFAIFFRGKFNNWSWMTLIFREFLYNNFFISLVACIYKLWIVRISLDWTSKVKTNSRHISNVYFLYGESKPNETGQIIWFRAKFNSTGKNIGKSGLDMLGWISNKEKWTHFCLFFQIHHNLVVELKMLYINAEAWLACILSVIEIGIDNTYRYY